MYILKGLRIRLMSTLIDRGENYRMNFFSLFHEKESLGQGNVSLHFTSKTTIFSDFKNIVFEKKNFFNNNYIFVIRKDCSFTGKKLKTFATIDKNLEIFFFIFTAYFFYFFNFLA